MEKAHDGNHATLVTGKPEGLINVRKWPREIDHVWPTKFAPRLLTPLEAITSLSGKRNNFRDVLMS